MKHEDIQTFCSRAPMTDNESSAARKSSFIRQPIVNACNMLKNEAIGFVADSILCGSPSTHSNVNQMTTYVCMICVQSNRITTVKILTQICLNKV